MYNVMTVSIEISFKYIDIDIYIITSLNDNVMAIGKRATHVPGWCDSPGGYGGYRWYRYNLYNDVTLRRYYMYQY